jgi:hypothetical protein
MLADNRLVDYWFDREVKPYLTRLDYDKHELTPELIKFKLLQNQAVCFIYPDFIIIGQVVINTCKEFYIMFLAGRNIKKHYTTFIEDVKQFGVSRISGHNINKINNLHQRNLSNIPLKFSNRISYRVDLDDLDYSPLWDQFEDKIELLPNSGLDYWWGDVHKSLQYNELDLDESLVKNKLLNNQLFCYRINNCVIIGFVSNGIHCKQFIILWISGKNVLPALAKFFNHVEMVEYCRYVGMSSGLRESVLFDKWLHKCAKSSYAIRKQNFSFLSLIGGKNE